MAWAEVSLSIPRELAAGAELALEDQGALAISFLDSADDPVLEPAPGTAPLWPHLQLRGLFAGDVNRTEVSLALLGLLGVDRPDVLAWREVADQDWVRAWMDAFQPMKFGQHLWIVPSGMQDPEDDSALVLRLDPGLAFGTGTHPTTALCLQWIDEHDFTGQIVVDYGCGSGVLGIAAALKGARRVVCVDNDPQALEATSANAARNGVSARLVCLTPECYGQGQGNAKGSAKADVVLANILAGPLLELQAVLLGSLLPGGDIVLSGILQEQSQWVADAYRPACKKLDGVEQDGWVRLHGLAL
jgi:ribosomal protein L11 methyltransferase